MGKMRVAKLRVGILRVEVRAKCASIWVKCETSECASLLLAKAKGHHLNTH